MNSIFKRLLLVIAIAGSLFACDLAATSHSLSAMSVKDSQSCASACHGHAQIAAQLMNGQKEEDDDKKPAPLVATWVTSSASLLLLYTAPFVILFVFIDRHRERLLTTQLRF